MDHRMEQIQKFKVRILVNSPCRLEEPNERAKMFKYNINIENRYSCEQF